MYSRAISVSNPFEFEIASEKMKRFKSAGINEIPA
jgi:hypothetical protein